MASRLEEELCCPICHEVYRDPVVLSCSHSFCRDCLESWWEEKPTRECPVCNRRSSREHPPNNRALKNLCEALIQERAQRASEDLCSLHSEKLKLFCLDHQEPVCLVCRDSETHVNHTFRPINEAAQQHRKKLEETLEPLKKKLKVFEEMKVKCEETAKYRKLQTRRTEKQIQDEFKMIIQFLAEEEEARMAALRDEEEQKNQMMKEKMEALSRDIATMSDTIRATEEQLTAEDISFLTNYKAAVDRVQQRPLLEDPQLPPGALIDKAKHLGNLTFHIWNKMKGMVSYTPVVLDPNTAHPHLSLSKTLTSVRREEKKVPVNPERFDHHGYVLCSEVFDSGTHSWDVRVGDGAHWALGVFSESVKRKGVIQSGFWGIDCFEGQYSVVSSTGRIYISVQDRPERIRVDLNFVKGYLAFYNLDTNTHIHTIYHKFTDRLCPLIGSGDKLLILPMEICVTLKWLM